MAVIPALFGLLLAALVSGQTVDISPREAVRKIGDELVVICKVPYEIDLCGFTIGGTTYRLKPQVQDGDVVFTGNGLQAGECGARIRHVREEWNGDITCSVPPPSGPIELKATMKLVVARAPEPPRLLSPEQPVFREGDRFEAQCVVSNGRPAAKLSWLIDDQPLLEGLHQPKIETDPATGLTTIRQNLTRVILADDAGRKLTCRAEHEALLAPREATRQLAITYPPRPIDGETKELTIFGLTLGEEGIVNVTVRSAPAPVAEWRFSDVRLAAGDTTPDGSATALHPALLGGGYYNVSLVLRPVVKEHVDQTFHLILTNDLGREAFVVHISTLDEPAGVQLDTGAIVGIVVAVLVLIIAVSLIVFAKATDRWCFAGGRGREHKNSGESTPAGDVLLTGTTARTDTESAAGGARTARSERSRLSALSARVRAALPRAKDKVKDTEQPQDAEEKLSDDKKGVVYAELALGEQNQGDKPPPPATEYAEIVYTDQQKETKE